MLCRVAQTWPGVPIYQTDNDTETTAAGLDHIFASPVPPTAMRAILGFDGAMRRETLELELLVRALTAAAPG